MALKKGIIYVAERSGKKPIQGFVSPSGLGLHKATDRSGYTITHLASGKAVKNVDTQKEGREQLERISKVTDWKKKEIKPSRDLAEKLQYASRGEKRPRKYNKKYDEYDLKAHARPQGHLVEHEQAASYKGQKKERRYIQHELRQKHIGYTMQATNTTKGRRIK